ncbi:hypothetical protein QSH57_010190 [Fusarium oxysporum f. sp. vasinfectum]|nr:hypothetical protein QSH57_010190 [Fusarium oxysporum f. sp. vasinfectum]
MAAFSILPEQNRQQEKVDDSYDSEASGTSIVGLGKKGLSVLEPALVMIGLCSAGFCMALDNTTIATAIPRIREKFHT